MKIFSAIIVFCFVLMQAAGAQTATPPPAGQVSISGWRVECDSKGAALNCRVTNQAVQTGTGLVIAALGVALAADTKKPVLTLQLPLGLAVSDPVTLSTDGASQPYTLITCDRAGCFARAPISDALLEKMRGAKQPLRIGYNVINATLVKQTITLTLPLDGFDASLTKIK
jgi:invasion protein IalB